MKLLSTLELDCLREAMELTDRAWGPDWPTRWPDDDVGRIVRCIAAELLAGRLVILRADGTVRVN